MAYAGSDVDGTVRSSMSEKLLRPAEPMMRVAVKADVDAQRDLDDGGHAEDHEHDDGGNGSDQWGGYHHQQQQQRRDIGQPVYDDDHDDDDEEDGVERDESVPLPAAHHTASAGDRDRVQQQQEQQQSQQHSDNAVAADAAQSTDAQTVQDLTRAVELLTTQLEVGVKHVMPSDRRCAVL